MPMDLINWCYSINISAAFGLALEVLFKKCAKASGIIPSIRRLPPGKGVETMKGIEVEAPCETARWSEEIYREYHPMVLNICWRYLESKADAEDAAAEIFLRLPRALKSYDPAQPFSRWISAVASHYCVDVLRRRQSEKRVFQSERPADLEPAAPGLSPLQELECKERASTVHAAIGTLRKHYRAPLVLYYFEDLTDSQIAVKLGQSRANVRIRIWRAKNQLRAMLRPAGRP